MDRAEQGEEESDVGERQRTILVTGLQESVTLQEIRACYAKFGSVVGVLRRHPVGARRGFAFVTYESGKGVEELRCNLPCGGGPASWAVAVTDWSQRASPLQASGLQPLRAGASLESEADKGVKGMGDCTARCG